MDDIHYNYNAYNRTSTYILESTHIQLDSPDNVGVLVGVLGTGYMFKKVRNYKIEIISVYNIVTCYNYHY